MVGLRALRARPRLVAAVAVGLALGVLLPGDLRGIVAHPPRLGCAVLIWLGLVGVMMVRSDLDGLQARADEDAGAMGVLLLAIVAAVASLAAIGIELHAVAGLAGTEKRTGIELGAATILLSWLFTHTMFAVHYAHDFYAGEHDRRGLAFPGTEDPEYWDFMYFAFNLGAASQTSDVQVETSRMRAFVLIHTVLSFLFNTTVLALAINVGAGLL